MNWCTRIVCATMVLLVFLVYCWMLKNNPVKTESVLFKEVNSLPELSFSKLADLDNKLAAELDVIPIDEFERIRNKELEQFMIKFKQEEPVIKKQNGSLRVIVLTCLSLTGVFLMLCLGRIIIPRCHINKDSVDSDRSPIVNSPSQETCRTNYQTEKY